MTDIVEKLRGYARDDHERGCQGREYDCSCGYDGKRDTLLVEAADKIERLRAEVQVWINHTKTAVWSDSEECKLLTRVNAALLEAPTVDIEVVVPDRDYGTMTPKDCYEAGLLDGVYQAREAIKAAARAALGGDNG